TIVDAQGCCVLPGFVDAHSHLLWAGSRADEYAARVRGQPYWGGGIMRTVRMTRAAPYEELLRIGRRRLRSYLRHGITALGVQCRRILNKAHGLGYQLKLHASQLAPGDGPRLAVDLGATSVDHLDYLRDSDARMLAESSVVCVVCPGTTTNLRLAGEGSARA